MARLTRSNPSIPIIVLILGLLITLSGTIYVHKTVQHREELQFEHATRNAVQTIENRLESYVALLRALRGVKGMGDPMGRVGFHRYIDSMDLPTNYAGIQGVGYSIRVRPEDRSTITDRMKKEGVDDFRIWPEQAEGEQHAVLFLEPQNPQNQTEMGHNMFTDEVRRSAMIKARDSGVAAMSGLATSPLGIEGADQPGFLIFLPVYEGHMVPERLADRRSKLHGFAYSAFQALDFFEPIPISGGSVPMAVSVYDGAEMKPENLLFASNPESDPGNARYSAVEYIAVARRTWAVAFHALPEFNQTADRQLVPLAAIVGLMVTTVLFALSWSQMRSRRAAEGAAAQLRVSQEKLAAETREARQARTEAETANRLKDQFLATVSHELRTPLNAILGWSDLLLDDPDVSKETQHGLEVIGRNVRAQNQLVEDLLDVSRIISGRLRLDLSETDVREVVESSVESVRPAAEAREIEVKERYASDLPRIDADPTRLQQIVWNLLSNAVKFSPKGSVVDLLSGSDGSHVTIEVTDHGQGIEPEFLPYIFNTFRQADSSTSRKHGGLGLGLSIVKHLVEMHGGTIEVRSEGAGKGATFSVVLPVRSNTTPDSEESPATPAIEEEARDQPHLDGDLNGVRALVVDDEPDARELLRSLLEKHGAEVFAASSADEALRLFSWGKPSVIVSDIGMPEKDGYQLIRELRQMDEHPLSPTPAIALTAFASERDRLAATDAGFAVHLSKPVKAAELLTAVRRLTEKRANST